MLFVVLSDMKPKQDQDNMESIWALVDTLMTKQTTGTEQYSEYICECGGLKYTTGQYFHEESGTYTHIDLPTCKSCGKVDDYYISNEAEWTSGIDADGEVSDPSRCGAPVDTELFSEKWGMGTVMQTYGQSYHVKKLSMINFHSSMNHRDRSLFHTYKEFDTIKEKLKLNDAIIRTAKIMYKNFSESKLTRGNVRSGIKANCVFMACKEHNYPRTTKEIAEAFDISTRDIGRTIETFLENTPDAECKVTKPRDVVVRIISQIKISDEKRTVVRKKIFNMCDSLEGCVKLMGKTPTGVACAIVYTVLSSNGVPVSKQDVCTAASVSVPTLNKIETIIKQEIV
jgi:transcription initiation factor TFIIIB Brf1 subunit/transcription initiation factor TFIIB